MVEVILAKDNEINLKNNIAIESNKRIFMRYSRRFIHIIRN